MTSEIWSAAESAHVPQPVRSAFDELFVDLDGDSEEDS
jgi:hypothetical protein